MYKHSRGIKTFQSQTGEQIKTIKYVFQTIYPARDEDFHVLHLEGDLVGNNEQTGTSLVVMDFVAWLSCGM